MRFGIYLMRRGILTAEQLVDAWERQQDSLAPLGQIAIEEGMLSVRDVFKILRVQSDLAHDRFGDTAVEMGLLNRLQVAELLMLQADRRRPLIELLIELGYLTPNAAEREMSAYRRDMERSGAQESAPAMDWGPQPTALSSSSRREAVLFEAASAGV